MAKLAERNYPYGIKCTSAASQAVSLDNPAYLHGTGFSVYMSIDIPAAGNTSGACPYSEGNTGDANPYFRTGWRASDVTQLFITKRDDAASLVTQKNFSDFHFLAGEHYDLVITDDTAGTLQLYVSGKLESTQTYTPNTTTTFNASTLNSYRRTGYADLADHTYYRCVTGSRVWTAAEIEDSYLNNNFPADIKDDFRFPEGTGTTTTSEQSTAATLVNTPEWRTDTPFSAKLAERDFPFSTHHIGGSGGTNAVDFGTDASMSGEGDFTLGIWAYANDLEGGNAFPVVFTRRTNTSNREYALYVTQSASAVTFDMYDTGGTAIGSIFANSGRKLRSQTWYHLVVTRSGNNFVLYFDGKVEDTGTRAGTVVDKTATVTTGSNVDSGTSNWDGQLTRPVFIKGYAATAAEVSTWYNNNIIPSGGGTLGLRPLMTEGTGTMADSSGQGNTGTLDASVTWDSRSPF